jgi:large repetitive protein
MRRIVAVAVCLAVALSSAPAFAAPRAAQPQGASISGLAHDSTGQPLGNTTVRLRNVETGQLAGTTTSGANGAFSFTGLQAGQYLVEVVDAAGQILATSAAISVAAGGAITGITVTTTAALGAAAAGGGISTAVIITTVAAAAGVAGAVAIAKNGNASPSR